MSPRVRGWYQVAIEQTKKISERNVVTQHNRLINSRHSLSVSEQKLYLAMVAQIKKEDSDFATYRINIKDFVELTGTNHKGEYSRAKEITHNLLKKVVEIVLPNGDLLQTHFLGSAYYKNGAGYVEVSFHPKLKPFLLELQRNYTSYDIRNILPLKGKYAIRMYELLKQFRRTGERTISTDELIEVLDIPESYSYGRIKKYILKPVQEELSEHTDITFDFEEKKQGRRISSLRFSIVSQDRVFQDRQSPKIYILPKLEDTLENITLNNPNPLYETLKEAVIKEYDVAVYNSWFDNIEVFLNEDIIEIYYENKFKKDWVSKNYLTFLAKIFTPNKVSLQVNQKSKQII